MTEPAALALAGVQVVELAEGVAGPYATKLLADLGAEVVKIEPPRVGDYARRCGPFPDHQPHPERSGLFLYLNTNKLGVTLNLDTSLGRDLFCKLMAQADVLIEDCAPGWLAAHGLGYETLQQQRPGLVMTSVTRFGQDGPQAHYHAYPLTTFHAGGEGYTLPGRLSLELFPDRAPVQAGGSLGEYDSGLCAAVATLGALLSGIGQHVDVSQQEALLNLNRPMLAYYLATGEVISRQRGYAFGGAIPCRDGYIMLRPIEDNHWRGLARAMGQEELADDERFRTRQAQDGQRCPAERPHCGLGHAAHQGGAVRTRSRRGLPGGVICYGRGRGAGAGSLPPGSFSCPGAPRGRQRPPPLGAVSPLPHALDAATTGTTAGST